MTYYSAFSGVIIVNEIGSRAGFHRIKIKSRFSPGSKVFSSRLFSEKQYSNFFALDEKRQRIFYLGLVGMKVELRSVDYYGNNIKVSPMVDLVVETDKDQREINSSKLRLGVIIRSLKRRYTKDQRDES